MANSNEILKYNESTACYICAPNVVTVLHAMRTYVSFNELFVEKAFIQIDDNLLFGLAIYTKQKQKRNGACEKKYQMLCGSIQPKQKITKRKNIINCYTFNGSKQRAG